MSTIKVKIKLNKIRNIRYQSLVGGCEPLQSYLHKRLAENLNSEAALGTVNDVAQCVQWLRSTFLFVRAARDPKKYLGLPQSAPAHLISKKIEELCVKAMNGLASSGLITMDEASCIQSTEAGRLLSIYYLDLETMKLIMKIKGNETLEQLLWIVCESHELSDMHLRVDERRCLNALNRNNTAATIRFPMKGKINTRQMKLNCIIQAVLGCLPIHDPSLNQEAMKIMRIADRICKCLVAYVTRPTLLRETRQNYQVVLNSILLAKCIESHLWEDTVYVSKQLKGIGPTFSTLLATAGKSNFMLLEESHPRDLERIMNKGPPAGNVLRKQVGLLPKYQLTITPIEENSVKIHLILLNQSYLTENIEHLTAGPNHKCYIIIGDTENYLLQLTSFKDKDLLSVYDGQITYDIVRRHNFEHKIITHCISSNFAGIDVQCEYIFNSLDALASRDVNSISAKGTTPKSTHIKQTAITDTFKLRKRKNYIADTCQVQKRKCDYTVIDKIKSLYQTSGESNRVIEKEMNKKTIMSHKVLDPVQIQNVESDTVLHDELTNVIEPKEYNTEMVASQNYEEIDDDNYVDNEQINSILTEIEKDIYKHDIKIKTTNNTQYEQLNEMNKEEHKVQNVDLLNEIKNKDFNNKSRKLQKSNFNVIDNIEKRSNLSDGEEFVIYNNKNTFVDTVKGHIDDFFQKTKESAKKTEKNIIDLLEINQNQNSTKTTNNDKAICSSDDTDFSSNSKKRKLEHDVLYSITDNVLSVSEKDDTVLYLESHPKENIDIKKQDFKIPEKETQNYKMDKNLDKNSYISMDQKLNDKNLLLPTDTDNNIFYNQMKPNCKYFIQSLINFDIDLPTKRCLNNNYFDSKLDDSVYRKEIPIKISSNESNCLVPRFPLPNKIVTKDNKFYSNNILISVTPNEDESMEKHILDTQESSMNNVALVANNHTDLESNIYDCSKTISYTKSHLNIYTKNTLESNYCVISSTLKIDVNIFKTQSYNNTSIENKFNNTLPEKIRNKDKKDIAHTITGSKLGPFKGSDKNYINSNEIVNELQHEDFPSETKKTLTESSFLCEQNTVIDIISKYKNIMSSKINTSKVQDQRVISSATRDNNMNISQCQKIKRPYKITDLPNLQQTTSQILNSPPVLQPSFKLEARKTDIKNTEDLSINKYKHTQDELLVKRINQSKAIFNLQSLEPKSPIVSFGSPQFEQAELLNDDIAMSQSMFNPKALLECLQQDVIIPPPSQFCDNEIMIKSNIDSNPSENDYISSQQSNEENNTNILDIDKDSFVETLNRKLTPTKEIETWTLSIDDGVRSNPYEPFTIARNNYATNFNPREISSRKFNLNKYKFSPKSIYKLHK